MKILIATGIYPPDIGGPATYSKLLFDELPRRGIPIAVLSFGEVRHLPKVIRHIAYFWKLIFHASDAEIIYAQDPVSVGLPASLAAKFLGKRFVLKIVGDYAWEQGTQRYGIRERLDEFSSKSEGYPFFVKLLKWIQTFVAMHAERVIVPSEYLKKIVSNWGVEPERIRVIYNAFDVPEISMMKSVGDVLRENSSAPTLLSVGRLVSWKGFDTLIALMPELIEKYPGITLQIIGEGPERKKLEDIILEQNLQKSVILLGKMTHDEVIERLRAATLFVLNTFYEGFSHQLLEALALGVPVVTTRVGGNPEIIDPEKNGLLVYYNDLAALTDAIQKVLDNSELRETFGRMGKAKASEFTKERMLSELMKQLA